MKFAITLLALSLALTGCGNDFNPTSSGSNNLGSGTGDGGNNNSGGNNNGDNNNGSGNEPTPVNPGEDFSFSASVGNNTIFGATEVIRYNSDTNALELVLPFPLGGLVGFEVTGSLPNYPQVTFSTNLQDNTLVLSIPLNEYVDLIDDVTQLPTGRPLPGIPGGEPPSFGFPIGNGSSNTVAYVAPDYIALYSEIGFDPFLELRFPIRANNQVIGYLHLLRPMNGEKGGVFLSIQLPRELTALIESIR